MRHGTDANLAVLVGDEKSPELFSVAQRGRGGAYAGRKARRIGALPIRVELARAGLGDFHANAAAVTAAGLELHRDREFSFCVLNGILDDKPELALMD